MNEISYIYNHKNKVKMKHKLKVGDKLYYLKSERDYKAERNQGGYVRIYKKSIGHVVIDKVGRDYAYANSETWGKQKINLETLASGEFSYVRYYYSTPEEISQEEERQQISRKIGEMFRYSPPKEADYTKLKAIANILEIEVTPVKYEEQ